MQTGCSAGTHRPNDNDIPEVIRLIHGTNRIGKRRILLLLLASVFLMGGPARAAEESVPSSEYVENEWNYLDMSMDVSSGIPDNVLGQLASIRDRGVLRVATDPFYPPQEFIDPSLTGQDQYVGADMELARRIAQVMGVELEIVPMDFVDVLGSVVSRKCDLAISALSYTPGRAAMTEMSKGYHYAGESAGNSLIVRAAEADQFADASSLADRVLAAERGSLQEALGVDNIPQYLEFIRLPSIEQVFQAVESGQADAAIVNTENAESYLKQHPDAGLVFSPALSFHLPEALDGDRIAARKGEMELIAFVNGVIDQLLASGEYRDWMREAEEYAARLPQ